LLGDLAELRPRKRGNELTGLNSTAVAKKNQRQFDSAYPIASLKTGLHTIRHRTAGWLKADLIKAGKLDGTKNTLHAKV
jgi:hypothetical protein